MIPFFSRVHLNPGTVFSASKPRKRSRRTSFSPAWALARQNWLSCKPSGPVVFARRIAALPNLLWLRRIRLLSAFFCALSWYSDSSVPVRAEVQQSPAETDLNCAHCAATEIDRLVTLLADGILRDLVCRLSFEQYTPRSLSMALRLPEDEIMRRVATLRGWGLVRTTTNGSSANVIGAVPGEGQATLRRWTAKYCQLAGSCPMDDHFSTVAANYNDLRTTDIAPIRYIQTLLAGHHPLNAADIGCGSGRYSLLLLQQFPDLKLTCGDVNREMLNEAERYLKRNGQTGFSVKQTDASRLPFQAGSLDCVLTFNAFHHFDPEGFLNSARDALREGGMLFIYTRLKSQNAQSVWGRYFPGFQEKEARLTDREHIERWSHCMPGLSMVKVRTFGYKRDESLETLLHQARTTIRHSASIAKPS